MLPNIPTVNLGVIAVSRDCFIRSLSERRRAAVVKACATAGINVNEIKVTVSTIVGKAVERTRNQRQRIE